MRAWMKYWLIAVSFTDNGSCRAFRISASPFKRTPRVSVYRARARRHKPPRQEWMRLYLSRRTGPGNKKHRKQPRRAFPSGTYALERGRKAGSTVSIGYEGARRARWVGEARPFSAVRALAITAIAMVLSEIVAMGAIR